MAQAGARSSQLDFLGGLEFFSDQNATRLGRDLRQVIEAVAEDAGISAEEVRAPRGRSRRKLRLAAIYLTGVVYDHSMCACARLLGLSAQAGTYTGRTIEDRRDDPDFDAWLDRMEARLSRQDMRGAA